MSAPENISEADFKSMSVEAGQWLWGLVQGGFNEKAKMSQIIVDAIIGCIPLLGDVTAVRDLIAVTMGLYCDPKKREDTMEWVTLVILILALIPVLGGIIKGVGRIVVRAAKAARLLPAPESARVMGEAAQELIEFLTRLGKGDAKKWFLELNIMEYARSVKDTFAIFMEGFAFAFEYIIASKLSWVIPDRLLNFMDALARGLRVLKKLGERMIPEALKEFHRMLTEMQEFIRSGGQARRAVAAAAGSANDAAHMMSAADNVVHMASTSDHTSGGAKAAGGTGGGARPPEEIGITTKPAQAGKENVSMPPERRELNRPPKTQPRARLNGSPQNVAIDGEKHKFAHLYQPEPGYPDLTARAKEGHFTAVEAYSGKMLNKPLEDESIFRIYGPPGETHGIEIGPTVPQGRWWGVGELPDSGKAWREGSAVLDEFNRDKFYVKARRTAPPQKEVRGVFGKVSEQTSTIVPGQYLPGGGQQAFLDFAEVTNAKLEEVGKRVMQTGKVEEFFDPVSGLTFEFGPTNWKNVNGHTGYTRAGKAGTSTTVPVKPNEVAPKTNPETHVNFPAPDAGKAADSGTTATDVSRAAKGINAGMKPAESGNAPPTEPNAK
ncbi:MAG: hypothetical protein LBG78_01640 [Azoarcus sp.]|jgi:hypothetical protein|nr:hypothetical protein [Azoarcus sp.]